MVRLSIRLNLYALWPFRALIRRVQNMMVHIANTSVHQDELYMDTVTSTLSGKNIPQFQKISKTGDREDVLS